MQDENKPEMTPEAEHRLMQAQVKMRKRTGNDFSHRRVVIEPGLRETPNGTIYNGTDDTVVIPEKVMENFVNPAQLNQCDVPDPRIVKMPTMFGPPPGGYKRDELVTMVGKTTPHRTMPKLNAVLRQILAKDVVQADGSQNYLQLRNKRR